ncbi:hypothetical protein DPEC_G00107270 [Dallia pectoralis]|uniref:Uncharacterized protein n=1 Tax=Dallia pectoralis TaxID=75939 RepID=A0ACC2GS38_DALPE|nr:hypothetical protein DPEC_G00107270 [Dallia pectoralis]
MHDGEVACLCFQPLRRSWVGHGVWAWLCVGACMLSVTYSMSTCLSGVPSPCDMWHRANLCVCYEHSAHCPIEPGVRMGAGVTSVREQAAAGDFIRLLRGMPAGALT